MLLTVDKLHVSYPLLGGFFSQRCTKVVKNISFEIQRGEVLGLVGNSGCGKSTIARCITGLIPKDSGQVFFEGQALKACHPQIQMIFQDPANSLNPRMNIFNNIRESLRYGQQSFSKNQSRDHIAQLLEQVGIGADQLQRYPHEFSGGQLQRIGIARALAPSPKLIVCDEPVSALDISIQAQVLNLLKSLQKQHGLSLLFVTHDLAVVRYISNRCAVMSEGEIVEQGATEDLIQKPQHAVTKNLLACVPELSAGLGSGE